MKARNIPVVVVLLGAGLRPRLRVLLGAGLRPRLPWLGSFVFAVLVALPALGSTVEVRCARLTPHARDELEARARLLLVGAGLDRARVAVECTPAPRLVWVDGAKLPIDESSGLVEGALDAIEDRIARPKTGFSSGRTREVASPPAIVHAATSPPPETPSLASTAPSDEGDPPDHSSVKSSFENELEGGLGLATEVEYWSGSMLAGPRLDVGVVTGKGLAVILSEGARYGLGAPDLGNVLVLDLRAGVGYGAPCQARTALGVALFFGAERLAVSSGHFADGGVWTWGATVSLGLRGSLALGPVDAWVGIDGMLRSTTIETDGPGGVAVPQLSTLISFGGFLPAFSRTHVPSTPPSSGKELARTAL